MSNLEQNRNTPRQDHEQDADLSSASIRRPSEAVTYEGIVVSTPTKKQKVLDVTFTEVAANVGNKESYPCRWSEDKCFVVWQDDRFKLIFNKFGQDKVAENPNLPPFSVTLTVQPGKDVYMERDRGWSSLRDDSATIIREGTSVINFYKSHEASQDNKKPFLTLTINLDKSNDWGYPERPETSPESRALKKSWNRFWHPESSDTGAGFILESTSRKPLEFKTPDEMRKLAGPAELIKIWERDHDAPLEDIFLHEDIYRFAYDKKSNSYAMGEYTYGESDHRLYIFNDKAEFVGYYRVQDDGSREWLEAFPGELGKPAK
jgi:hypothetical protein